MSALSNCNSTSASGSMESPGLDEQLLNAVKLGGIDYVVDLLRSGASPRVQHEPDGGTVLHVAADYGWPEVIKVLVEHGAEVDGQRRDGSSALHLAARQGLVAAGKALLEAGAPTTSRDNSGRTPLHVAVQAVWSNMVQQLLDAGADLEAADHEGLTPLLLASSCSPWDGQPASLLLAAGADPAAKCPAGNTPLHYACLHRSLTLVRVLLAGGAPVDAVDQRGVTPLYVACTVGTIANTDVVDALIASGAQATIPTNSGWIPLHGACDKNQLHVANRLLRADPTPGHVNASGPGGFTPLHLAASHGDGNLVTQLLKSGADVAARDMDGSTPLLSAAASGHASLVKQLLKAGADAHASDDDGDTALHLAAAGGHTVILRGLLKAGVAVDGQARGLTPLALATEKGHISCVKELLKAGADPGKVHGAAAEAAAGATVLHRAVQLGHTALVPLLATPANMRHLWQGDTPLHMALLGGRHPSMAQALVAAGSPAGVANADGVTAMALAAAAHWVLLPAMVRRECERYKQLQQDGAGQQQEQLEGEQQDPAAVLAAVVDAVCALLEGLPAASAEHLDIIMSCIRSVMEVLGGAAGSRLVQQVLGKFVAADAAALAAAQPDGAGVAAVGMPDVAGGAAPAAVAQVEAAGAAAPDVAGAADAGNGAVSPAAAGSSSALHLAQALSRGCSAALEPLMEQRWALTNRLQQLVKAPHQQPPAAPQQQPEEGQQGPGAAAEAALQAVTNNQLSAQAMAAAQAGGWHHFVQLWEQLTGRQPELAESMLSGVQQQLQEGKLVGVDGLCGALMQAWVAAHQQVGVRKQRERAQAVVGAVQAAQQLQGVAGRGRRQRGGSSMG